MDCSKLLESVISRIRKNFTFDGAPSTDYETDWLGNGPGFTDEFIKLMYKKYKENLNIQGSGAVVAAPDFDTPGGSYYYHWMRDAGLTMKSWMEIHNDEYDAVKDIFMMK